MSNNNDNSIPTNRFTFQYFNQEFDVGIINEQGECMRKKKKPGRKSNPPSQQEKRTKNRLAQKVFREREQQRKKEKERQQLTHEEEIQALKSKLAIAQFESKYLKACVLHLILSCVAQTGVAPRIWPETLIICNNLQDEWNNYYQDSTENEVEQTPALLDILLKDECIVDFGQAISITIAKKPNIISNLSNEDVLNDDSRNTAFFPIKLSSQVLPLNRESQEVEKVLHKARKSMPSPAASTSSSQFSGTQTSSSQNTFLSSKQQEEPEGSGGWLMQQQKNVIGIISSPPPLKTMDDLAKMPPLQAIHILKLQMKLSSILGSALPGVLIPTAIQRVIPHDIRIDLVPGAAIRDRMILYQDYYNIDEYFQLLSQSTVFLGGDVRDITKWSFAPQYTSKYWFISHFFESCNEE